MSRTTLSVAILALVALVASLAPPGGTGAVAQEDGTPRHLQPDFIEALDEALLHGTVTPPGAEITEKDAERLAYDNLVFGYPDLTQDEIFGTYFKDGRFYRDWEVGREYSPRNDVTVKRDAKWGVPHIYGDTDEGVAFGAGYTAAEDRLPIMEGLRALGRAETFRLAGGAEAWTTDGEIARLYGYTEEELQAQIDRLPEVYGQTGEDAVRYLQELVAGINHFIVQMQEGHVDPPAGLADVLPPNTVAPWRTTDIVAVVAIIRALFGAGGGSELGNAATFASLADTYGVEDARRVYEDFRWRFNRDGPLHTLDSFAYMQPEVELPGTEGNVIGYSSGDPGPVSTIEELFSNFPGGPGQAASQLAALHEESRIKFNDIRLPLTGGSVPLPQLAAGGMSNWLMIGKELSATGHPMLLGGPQAAYFDPQILLENVMHGPTINAAGASFPGMGLVVIGRSHQAAWSATAGGSDMIDTYVEKLCDPDGGEPTEDETHYLYDEDGDGEHECIPMDRRLYREGPTLPGGEVLPDIYVERTVHGPVTGRGRVGDTPVAISFKRSTYMKELDAAVSILKMNTGQAETGEDFVDIFGESHNLSTNWAYVNDEEFAYFHGGLYPDRPDDVHPDLPVWGTGEWEWAQNPDGTDRYLTTEQHPHEVNDDRGFATSWNNRQAPGWSSSDSNWGFSSVYRSDMLADQVAAAQARGDKIDPVQLVQIMERAGLTDLRGSHNLPLLLEVLEAGQPPSEREAQMVEILREWIDPDANPAGIALRRDGDEDGNYDRESAVAIMDAWWGPLIHAMYDAPLGQDVTGVSRQGIHNAPSPIGSAFQGGFYGQVWTDLAMLLDKDVDSPTSQIYCGSDTLGADGTLEACAERLWQSLAAAGDSLQQSSGSNDPSSWGVNEQAERIIFLPNAALQMHWVNRPTTQVFAMFGRDAEPAPDAGDEDTDAAPAPDPEDRSTPVTGAGAAFPAVVLALLAAAALRRRGRREQR